MNKKYIEELFNKNKKLFLENNIESPEELEEQMLAYITSNMQYDFDIDVDIEKLFKEVR